jgi:K+-sensing histidine kinase KdpD
MQTMTVPYSIISHLFEASDPPSATAWGSASLSAGICRSIAEPHGGELRYEPNPGGGTIFRFTLPVAPGNEPANGR